MFRAEKPGGLGLTDTTGKTGLQAWRLALPRREPYFCPAGQISQKPGGAWRASQKEDGCPVCTGEKCYGFAAYRSTFPGRTGEGCRQNGRRAESAIIPRGKCYDFAANLFTSPQRRQMYACRISMTEGTVLCFMLPVQELFMKIPGAVVNC